MFSRRPAQGLRTGQRADRLVSGYSIPYTSYERATGERDRSIVVLNSYTSIHTHLQCVIISPCFPLVRASPPSPRASPGPSFPPGPAFPPGPSSHRIRFTGSSWLLLTHYGVVVDHLTLRICRPRRPASRMSSWPGSVSWMPHRALALSRLRRFRVLPTLWR